MAGSIPAYFTNLKTIFMNLPEHIILQLQSLQKEVKRLRDKYEPGEHVDKPFVPQTDPRDYPEDIQYE